MNPVRIVILVVAAVAAIGLALLLRNALTQPKTAVTAQPAAVAAPPMARVLVAKTDLAIGDTLSKDNISWQDWPANTLNSAYITDGAAAAPQPTGAAAAVSTARQTITDIATNGGPKLQAMIGAIVKEPIFAGEPIIAKKIVRSGNSSYMAVRLAPGTRAMSLPINAESGAGGFIQPGDRVDVYSTHPDTSKQGGGSMVTDTVIRNALVLAIDQHTDAPKAGASQLGATITLEVPEGSVTTIARARSQGGLTMALRSYADLAGGARGPSVDDGRSVQIIRGGAPAEVVTAQ